MSTVRGVDVWWADLRAVDTRLFGLLDPRERARLDGMERAADRGRFVLGAVLLRVAVAAATGVDARVVAVERGCAECGEPHGAPRVEGVRVSVAHAGPLAVVATAEEPVGVDVEAADRGDDVAAWVEREARFKAGVAEAALGVHPLPAPVPGYIAALAVAGDGREPSVSVHGRAESAAALAALVERGQPERSAR